MEKKILIGNGDVSFEVVGITEDRKTLIIKDGESGSWSTVKMRHPIDAQHAVDVSEKELDVIRLEENGGNENWVVVDKILPIKLTQEKLEKAMMAHIFLRNHLMSVLKKTNYEGMGKQDEQEIKEDFDTACVAMARYMEILCQNEKCGEENDPGHELTCAGCQNEGASRNMDCCWDCNRNPRRKYQDLYRRKY